MTTTNLSTSLAELERVSPDRVVVRVRPGIQLSIENIRETRDACLRVTQGGPCEVLIHLPESTDFQLNVMMVNFQTDHEAANRHAKAIAFVTPGDLNARMLDIYFRYNPVVTPVAMFTTGSEAEDWFKAGAPM